jgi:hypothetical protein
MSHWLPVNTLKLTAGEAISSNQNIARSLLPPRAGWPKVARLSKNWTRVRPGTLSNSFHTNNTIDTNIQYYFNNHPIEICL